MASGRIVIPIDLDSDPLVYQLLAKVQVVGEDVETAIQLAQTTADGYNDLARKIDALTTIVALSLNLSVEMRNAIVATKEEMLAAVEETTTVGGSIVAALDLNTELLRAALADEGLDQEVIDRVTSASTALTADIRAAVVRNTVAETEPVEPV